MSTPQPSAPLSINREAMKLVRRILESPAALGVTVTRLPNGATVIDMGQAAPGGWTAARYYTQITLGGLGEVSYESFLLGDARDAGRARHDRPADGCLRRLADRRLAAGECTAPVRPYWQARPARSTGRTRTTTST